MVEATLTFSRQRRSIVGAVSVYLHSEMTEIVEFHLLFTVPDHESTRVELHVLLVDGATEDVVMLQILFLFVLL